METKTRSTNFENDFFLEEERCGFKISNKQKKVWAIELDLLQKLLIVCDKYDIRINMFCGTLLGTIRHKGFIPWDDDLDICINRNEYEKLKSIANKEFLFPYYFQTCFSDRRYFIPYARLRNSETTGIVTGQEDSDYNNGIYIDIIIMDDLIDNKILLLKQFFQKRFYEKMCNAYCTKENDKTGIKKIIVLILRKLKFFNKDYDFYMNKYEETLMKYNGKSNKIAPLFFKRKEVEKLWVYKKDHYANVKEKFEFLEVPIPSNYDSILRREYGDYMEFPNISERGEWHNGIITFDPDKSYKEYINGKSK